jgi:hypothetical protein
VKLQNFTPFFPTPIPVIMTIGFIKHGLLLLILFVSGCDNKNSSGSSTPPKSVDSTDKGSENVLYWFTGDQIRHEETWIQQSKP